MKKTTYSTSRAFVAIVISILSLAGCSKDKGETPIGRAGTADVSTWAQQNGLGLTGNVTDVSGQQSVFQNAVNGYLESLAAPEDIGYIAGNATGGTGVFLGGKVELQTGVLNPAGNTRIDIRGDSKLLVMIWDQYAGKNDPSTGKPVFPYGQSYSSASGYVQGNYAYIKFTNERGSVILEGNFSAQSFYGAFEYDNTRRWDGNNQDVSAGEIGRFHVPTCQFFRCQ